MQVTFDNLLPGDEICNKLLISSIIFSITLDHLSWHSFSNSPDYYVVCMYLNKKSKNVDSYLIFHFFSMRSAWKNIILNIDETNTAIKGQKKNIAWYFSVFRPRRTNLVHIYHRSVIAPSLNYIYNTSSNESNICPFIILSSRLSQVTPFIAIAIAQLNFIKESTSYIHNTILGISNTTFT